MDAEKYSKNGTIPVLTGKVAFFTGFDVTAIRKKSSIDCERDLVTGSDVLGLII